MKKDILAIFCYIHDFCKFYDKFQEQNRISNGHSRPTRKCSMHLSELLTIMIMYHTSNSKCFKFFYNIELQLYTTEFSSLLSYTRFLELIPSLTIPLTMILILLFGQKTGIYIIDSTTIKACHNKRRNMNRVFKGKAKNSKSSMGWFYGFKLHIIVNDKGELISVKFTPGNVDDRAPVLDLTEGLSGLLLADRGYIKQELFEKLYEKGLKMIHGIKANMKNKLLIMKEKLLLKKRNLVESVFNILKNVFEIEHTRHRSAANALVHILSTLVAYSFKQTKPSMKMV